MAQTARVTLTLSNIATEEDIKQMEERIMSALSDAVAQIQTAVSNLSVAQSPEKVAELEAAVQREREANEALVAQALSVQTAEDLEDTQQAQELADAKAANDALLAEMNTAATDLQGVSAQLSALGTAVDEAPDETPVGEVPVEVPDEAPADPAPPVDVPDDGIPADGGAPAEAGPTPSDPATPPAGGPVDTDGNPVDGPNL